MHPQQPWMMQINAQQIQRDVEHNMRLRQARASAPGNRGGLVSGLRRSIGLALIAAGDRIQPAAHAPREYDPGLELEVRTLMNHRSQRQIAAHRRDLAPRQSKPTQIAYALRLVQVLQLRDSEGRTRVPR